MNSPDSGYYYDEDLSTLSNIRINNRRSKQRLRNRVTSLDHTLDILLDSPTKSYVPSPLRKSYVPGNSRTPSAEMYFDSKIFNKENLVYRDKDEYEKNRVHNEQKRERILKSLESPQPNNRFSANKNTDIPQDVFHKSPLKRDIPDLRPKDSLSPFNQRPITSPAPTRTGRNFDLEISPARDNKVFSSQASFALPTERDIQSSSNIMELQRKIKQLEFTVEELHLTSESQIKDNYSLTQKNVELSREVEELNDFVDFLESNFDKVYKKMGRYKRDNQELSRVNTELSKLNEKYRDLLQRNSVDVNQDMRYLNSKLYDDGTTTDHLLKTNFN